MTLQLEQVVYLLQRLRTVVEHSSTDMGELGIYVKLLYVNNAIDDTLDFVRKASSDSARESE